MGIKSVVGVYGLVDDGSLSNEVAMPKLRSLLDPDPDYQYGSVLPLARHKRTGEMKLAIPGMIREPVQGLLGLFDEYASAVQGEGFDPVAITEGAMSMPAAGLLADAPTGALSANMIKKLSDDILAANKSKTQAAINAGLLADQESDNMTRHTLLENLWKADPERMQRAKNAGYDTDNLWFHGTTRDYNSFNPNRYGTRAYTKREHLDKEVPSASFFTQDPSLAAKYAGPRQATWMPQSEETFNKFLDENFNNAATKQRLASKALDRALAKFEKQQSKGNRWDDSEVNQASANYKRVMEETDYINLYRKYSNQFANPQFREGGNIKPVLLRISNPHTFDYGNEVAGLNDIFRDIKTAKTGGHDAAIIIDKSHGKQIAQWDPRRVRSIFAQFKDLESDDILAANRSPGLSLLGITDEDEPSTKKRTLLDPYGA